MYPNPMTNDPDRVAPDHPIQLPSPTPVRPRRPIAAGVLSVLLGLSCFAASPAWAYKAGGGNDRPSNLKVYATRNDYFTAEPAPHNKYTHVQIGSLVYLVTELEEHRSRGTLPDPVDDDRTLKTVAVGGDANASSFGAIAIGASSKAENLNAVAIGVSSKAPSGNAVAIGASSKAGGHHAVAIGSRAFTRGRGSVALGSGSRASRPHSTALGQDSHAESGLSTALGHRSHAQGESSIALGFLSQATGTHSIAIGSGLLSGLTISSRARATGTNSIALGRDTTATGTDSTALGRGAKASGMNSIALGPGAKATGMNSIALGPGAQATGMNSIAIGSQVEAGANEVRVGTAVTTTYKLPGLKTPSGTRVVMVDSTGRLFTQAGTASSRGTALRGAAGLSSDVTAVGRTEAADYEKAPAIGSGPTAPATAEQRRVVVQDTNRDGSVRLRTLDFGDLSGMEQRLAGVDRRVTSLSERLNKATAMSSALSALPNVVPGDNRFFLGVGAGHYSSEQALAIGMSARVQSRVFVNAGVALASGDEVSVRGGVGVVW